MDWHPVISVQQQTPDNNFCHFKCTFCILGIFSKTGKNRMWKMTQMTQMTHWPTDPVPCVVRDTVINPNTEIIRFSSWLCCMLGAAQLLKSQCSEVRSVSSSCSTFAPRLIDCSSIRPWRKRSSRHTANSLNGHGRRELAIADTIVSFNSWPTSSPYLYNRVWSELTCCNPLSHSRLACSRLSVHIQPSVNNPRRQTRPIHGHELS